MRIIDLTLDIRNGMMGHPHFAVHRRNPVKLEVIGGSEQQLAFLETQGASIAGDADRQHTAIVSRLCIDTHSGTHIEAPAHFIYQGLTVDKIPLEKLVGDAVVIDMTSKGADEGIGAEDLEGTRSTVGKGEIAIVRTDWTEKMYGKPGFWEKIPFFQPDVADWFIDRGVVAVGCDCYNDLALHRRQDVTGPLNHAKFLGHGIALIENLTNLSQLRRQRVRLIALPLKLVQAEASPARVVAIEE